MLFLFPSPSSQFVAQMLSTVNHLIAGEILTINGVQTLLDLQ